ncbi:hypothetical protein PIB30_038566 [Stylosanthes scabra]|uniref:Uncharacterized protein n=1 Tax=Stylosanthes scabra TaxID=79078 RepID=A0ABU6YBE3_9FABA|nr:hypothetical protein [Stylosanthes scabra]
MCPNTKAPQLHHLLCLIISSLNEPTMKTPKFDYGFQIRPFFNSLNLIPIDLDPSQTVPTNEVYVNPIKNSYNLNTESSDTWRPQSWRYINRDHFLSPPALHLVNTSYIGVFASNN